MDQIFASLMLWAGMPWVAIHEIGRLHVQSLSLFLALFVVSALLLRWLWNSLQSDWPQLPRMNVLQAFGMAAIWGLLMIVILGMIAGAREFLTPGAWERNGITYQLRDSKDESSP